MATTIWDGSDSDGTLVTAANWEGAAAPVSTDNMTFPAFAADSGSPGANIIGQDFSAVLLEDTTVEEGCFLNFGSRDTYLELDTDQLYYNGDGYLFLDIENAEELWFLNGRAAGSGFSFGANIMASTVNALTFIDIGSGNSLGLCALAGDTGEFTAIAIQSGEVTLGKDLTTTTVTVDGGTVISHCASAEMTITKGTVTHLNNAITTLNINGGRIYYNSDNAPTAVNLYGGVLDLSQDSRALTIGTINLWKGGKIYDPSNKLTITTLNRKVGGTTAIA